MFKYGIYNKLIYNFLFEIVIMNYTFIIKIKINDTDIYNMYLDIHSITAN